MYHEYVLVQKIQENARLKVYLAHQDCINWTYETSRMPNIKTDTPFFPLIIEDKTIQINEKSIGKETSCYKTGQKRICFSDDYSVPGGFLICITGPIGYIPTVVKFKKKPMILD